VAFAVIVAVVDVDDVAVIVLWVVNERGRQEWGGTHLASL
jgi:hypothetical protein